MDPSRWIVQRNGRIQHARFAFSTLVWALGTSWCSFWRSLLQCDVLKRGCRCRMRKMRYFVRMFSDSKSTNVSPKSRRSIWPSPLGR